MVSIFVLLVVGRCFRVLGFCLFWKLIRIGSGAFMFGFGFDGEVVVYIFFVSRDFVFAVWSVGDGRYSRAVGKSRVVVVFMGMAVGSR